MNEVELSVIIPAYNEAGTIEGTIQEISSYLLEKGITHEILVVDDGSTDDTSTVVRALSDQIPGLRLCEYAPNHGKGHAVKTGMLGSLGRMALFTDADNSTPINELPALMAAAEGGCDVAIGSRAVKGAVRVVHQPFYRELGGRFLNLFIRIFAIPKILDTQCGFKLFTRRAADAVFPLCFIEDFSFDIEALYLARRFGFKIAELPVHWTHHGESKVHPVRDGLKLLGDIVRIKLHIYKVKRGQIQG